MWLKEQWICPSGTVFLKAIYHIGLWITEQEGWGPLLRRDEGIHDTPTIFFLVP